MYGYISLVCPCLLVRNIFFTQIIDTAPYFSTLLSRTIEKQFFFSISGKLQRYEVPAAVTLCKEVWSPDMGLVTAAFKLKRKDIQDRYQHDINRMYAS